ncbi:NUDIX domain-containing protein [Clostridium chrysemydis]|uniref:NUDIX domain-containing protein n=1 Tax=Clostridium chrysemydis TaxID=2665504 RepID=UPI003F2E0267
MNLNRTLTSSVYVIYEYKVLLHMHKKHKTLFPLGGHMSPNEVPHETAIREVLEESGLQVELYNNDKDLNLGRVIQLHKPMHVLLENVGHEVENIDFIYFAMSNSNKLNPGNGESKEFYWFSKEEIENSNEIKPHVKQMALDALNTICR